MSKTLMFPGQGAQFVGMGKTLYDGNNLAKKLFDIADKILQNNFLDVCFNGPSEKLASTIYCQPALFVHSVAAVLVNNNNENLLSDKNIFLGLSLGELTALCVAGVFDFETGVRLVFERGKFMQQAADSTSGAMVSLIGGAFEDVQTLCNDCDVEISNINCPGQVVISGDVKKIDNALALADKMGFKRAIRLNVAGAYHSKLMLQASENFANFLKNVEFNTIDKYVCSNISGVFMDMTPVNIKKTLVEQIVKTVLFQKCVETSIQNGADSFCEYGPGKVLCGLVKRIDPNVKLVNYE